jgi:undecaprenyl-diphosphatase
MLRAVASRHPGDLLRLVLATIGLLATIAIAGGGISRSETDAFRLCNDLPRVVTPLAWLALVVGSVAVLGGAAAIALVVRRDRLAVDLVVVGGLAYGAARLVHRVAGRHLAPVPGAHHLAVPGFAHWPAGFPSTAMAVAAGFAAVAAPYHSRTATRLAWAGVFALAVARLYAGADLPLDLLAGALLGWGSGAVVNLLAGAPLRNAGPERVVCALSMLSVTATDLAPSGHDEDGRALYRGTAASGVPIAVHALDIEERSADLLFRAWRTVAFREGEGEIGIKSRERRIEHEALVSGMARRAGVRTADVIAAGQAGGLVLLVLRDPRGTPLTKVADPAASLPALWATVGAMHRARIAHGDLRPERVEVDGEGTVWLNGFGPGKTGATDHQRSLDVARLLATTAPLVGAKEAVSSAVGALGAQAVVQASPRLQRLALPVRPAHEWREQGRVLKELRANIAELTGAEAPPPAQLTRIKPRTLWSLLALGLAVYLLLPQVGHLRETADAVSSANWWWLVATLAATAVTYLAAAVALDGAVDEPLPLLPLTEVQVACSFTNRVTPAGTGGLGLNERYLERRGVTRSAAIAAVSLNVVAGAVVHFVATMLALGFLGRAGIGGIKVPPKGYVLLGAVAALAVLGAFLLRPLRRRLEPPLRRAARDLRTVLRRPVQALKLFGGSVGVTIGYALALAASLACFGVHASLVRVVLVYLGGTAVASVSPTPGALGAVEAALLAGLTGIGVAPGPALAGILAFRAITFWLPTVPGVVAFHEVQRRRWI